MSPSSSRTASQTPSTSDSSGMEIVRIKSSAIEAAATTTAAAPSPPNSSVPPPTTPQQLGVFRSLKAKVVSLPRKTLKNIWIYAFAYMFMKFALENNKGAVRGYVSKRRMWEASQKKESSDAMAMVALSDGLYYVWQVFGMILPAQIVRRFRPNRVVATSVAIMAVLSASILVVEKATGGYIQSRKKGVNEEQLGHSYGKYPMTVLYVLYWLQGMQWGVVDVMRKILPGLIVGVSADQATMSQINAFFHILYEISGTVGNMMNAFLLIPKLGANFAWIPAPICYAVAAVLFYLLEFDAPVNDLVSKVSRFRKNADGSESGVKKNFVVYHFQLSMEAVGQALFLVPKSIWVGVKLIFSQRRFLWLPAAYSLAQFGHRYLEDQIAHIIGVHLLGAAEAGQIIIGGANMGEMIGSALVLVWADKISSPQPWVRVDALTLLLLWVVGNVYYPDTQLVWAFTMAALFIPVCVGWAAGDMSVVGFISSELKSETSDVQGVSPLASMVGVLQIIYVIIYSTVSFGLGKFIDKQTKLDKAEAGGKFEIGGRHIHFGLNIVSGVLFTVIAVIIFASTFIPRGSWAWNPKMKEAEKSDEEKACEGAENGEGVVGSEARQ